ncbi:YcgN family cysteine cluster protein [Haliea atlantica]|nr:hypothetical protein [Haliea sp.]MAL94082.1 hypothetical protein [Haliea sp.]|tara:strand:- start:149145 stop:149600 length:456 start_codon:yes stop_codon:yes gene_type:complete
MTNWWDSLPLEALDQQQWEALCDGCGRCCLHKLQDEYSGELFYTRVHCQYLDLAGCRCTVYPTRQRWVPDCVVLDRSRPEEFEWMPGTCAYRLRAHGKPLPAWHPLRTGDPESVRRAGITLDERAISEEHVHPDSLEEHIVHWVDSREETA